MESVRRWREQCLKPVDQPGMGCTFPEIVREGARRMLAEALQAEVDPYIAAHAAERARTVTAWWCATARTGPGRC